MMRYYVKLQKHKPRQDKPCRLGGTGQWSGTKGYKDMGDSILKMAKLMEAREMAIRIGERPPQSFSIARKDNSGRFEAKTESCH